MSNQTESRAQRCAVDIADYVAEAIHALGLRPNIGAASQGAIAIGVLLHLTNHYGDLEAENKLFKQALTEGRTDLVAVDEARTKLEAENARLREAGKTVCEGFDKGIFQRNIENDGKPGWSLELLPYIRALAELHDHTTDETTGSDDKPVGPHPDGGFYVQPGDKGDKPQKP